MTKFLRSHHHHVVWLSVSGAISILLFAAVGVGAITYERAYQDRIFPGVRIGSIPVGEHTRAEALTRVQHVLDAYLGQGLPYVLDGQLVNIDPIIVGQQDPDLTYRLVDIDVPTLVDDAFAVGRRPSFRTTWTERARGALHDDLAVPLRVTIAEDQLEQALVENLSSNLHTMQPPRLIANKRDGVVTWTVHEGRAGRTLDPATIAAATAMRIATLDPAAIPVATTIAEPPYTKADVEAALPALDAALQRAPLTLTHSNDRWVVTAETLATWLTFQDGPAPTINAATVNEFLVPIAKAVEQPAESARLTINANTKRVREFRAAREGVRIDRALLATALHESVFGSAPPL
ncbi:MAG: peptidoglycan binding domain-containing protein, partial [bacterium]|nr:peptidoglycan binding domain-containing protein [bacterium]